MKTTTNMKDKIIYFKGDKAVIVTGEIEVIYGGRFYLAKLVEGHNIGKLIHVSADKYKV